MHLDACHQWQKPCEHKREEIGDHPETRQPVKVQMGL
jgi:hypothetical protein